MFSLPPVSILGKSARLPLGECESVLLANFLFSESRQAFDLLIKQSPEFLIWHAVRFDQHDLESCRDQRAVKSIVDQIADDEKTDEFVPEASESSITTALSSNRQRLLEILTTQFGLTQEKAEQWIGKHVNPALLADSSTDSSQTSPAIDLYKLVDLKQQLDKLTQEFDQRLRNEKLAAMKNLAYGASHEINNPLANISTRAETLLAGETDPDRRHRLAMISQQAYRAHEMISDLMLFANPPALHTSKTCLWNLVQSLPALDPANAQKDIAIETERGEAIDGDVTVDIDPVQIAVALSAIVKNASESARSDMLIKIHVQRENKNAVLVTISDNGPGIPDELAPYIFDPFFSGREAGRGLGFGLSKAWRIIDLHGGEISFSSLPNQATTFSIRLPVNHHPSE